MFSSITPHTSIVKMASRRTVLRIPSPIPSPLHGNTFLIKRLKPPSFGFSSSRSLKSSAIPAAGSSFLKRDAIEDSPVCSGCSGAGTGIAALGSSSAFSSGSFSGSSSGSSSAFLSGFSSGSSSGFSSSSSTASSTSETSSGSS